jgi:hypothetical protein
MHACVCVIKACRRRGSFVFLATINPCDTHALRWGGIVAVSHHASSICPGLEHAVIRSLTHSARRGHLKGRGVFACGRGSTARHKKTIALMDHARFSPRKQVVDGIACEIARQHFFNLLSLRSRAHRTNTCTTSISAALHLS